MQLNDDDIILYRQHILSIIGEYNLGYFFTEFNEDNPNNQLTNPHLSQNDLELGLSRLSTYDIVVLQKFLYETEESAAFDISIFNSGIPGNAYCDCVLFAPPGSSAYCQNYDPLFIEFGGSQDYTFNHPLLQHEYDAGTNQPAGKLSCDYNFIITPHNGEPQIFPITNARWHTDPITHPEIEALGIDIMNIDFDISQASANDPIPFFGDIKFGDIVHPDHMYLYDGWSDVVGQPVADLPLAWFLSAHLVYSPEVEQVVMWNFGFGLHYGSNYSLIPMNVFGEVYFGMASSNTIIFQEHLYDDVRIDVSQSCE